MMDLPMIIILSQFTCLEENTKKYINLQFQLKNKLQQLIKMKKKL